ncbi:hypothetical protein [Shewanella sp. MBTL60-007]|uniref:hypothetical protein n=1 Tax=Shewanella sp. MBTL60-007 TaxID=2815911 RepID=UPI001BC43F52|nr:hypothetical protein [Shewanella sp. MBTL60-007]GIU20079.1 hypothetical protein TUM3792_18500 [Shewanella sp. MBTL60-007]
MSTLFNFLNVIVLPIIILIQLGYIWGSLEATNSMLQAAVKKPLTGTKGKSEPMSPLTGTELVNEASTVNTTQPVNVTQTSTKREGGK